MYFHGAFFKFVEGLNQPEINVAHFAFRMPVIFLEITIHLTCDRSCYLTYTDLVMLSVS